MRVKPPVWESVVDTNLLVKNMTVLHVVGASVIPAPLSVHYQAVRYAQAMKAANLITASHDR